MDEGIPNSKTDSVELSGSRSGRTEAGPGNREGSIGGAASEGSRRSRPWLQVWFRCSGHYQRVYRHADGTSYHARCPKCGKQVRFRVGSGGTGERFFEVLCGLG